jgi:hypothetical protein
MSDTLQIVIVTAVAAGALLLLLRPLLQKRQPAAKAGGCANCSVSHAHGKGQAQSPNLPGAAPVELIRPRSPQALR